MGGNALKNCETRRLNKDDYFDLAYHVIASLKAKYSPPDRELEIIMIPSYAAKESFGDLDLLVSTQYLPADFADTVGNLFSSKEVIINGDAISMEVNGFQVDLIMTPVKHIYFAMRYFSYNDLGNLMGKIANAYGVKFGHKGVSYIYRDFRGDKITEIPLAVSFADFCKAFDFDIKEYLNGFNELEDIFRFVSKSRYFNPDIFLLENLNHKSRVRDSKRETYKKFLEWCEKKKRFDWEGREYPEIKHDKKQHLPMLFEKFQRFAFKDKLMNEYRMHLQNREARRKFNGDLVQSITSLKGESLGKFIEFFKKSVTKGQLDWDTYLAVTDAINISDDILRVFSKYFSEGHL